MERTKPVYMCVEQSERKEKKRRDIEEREPYLYDFLASHHEGVTNSVP